MATPNWDELETVDDDSLSPTGNDLPVVDDSELGNSVMLSGGKTQESEGLEPGLDPLDFYVPSRAAALGAEGLSNLGVLKLPKVAKEILGGLIAAGGTNMALNQGHGAKTTAVEGFTGALAESAGNKLFPGGGTGFMRMGPSEDDIAALSNPSIKKSLSFLERQFPAALGGRKANTITRLDSQVRRGIESVSEMAKDKVRQYGDQLGVGAHGQQGSVALLKQWEEKAPAVIDSPIFQEAKDVVHLGKLAREEADKTWANGISLLEKHNADLSLQPEDLAPFLKDATKEISTLAKSSYTEGMGQGRAEALLKTLQDLDAMAKSGGVPATDVADLVSDLNKYRREVLKEFDKATQSGLAQGQNVLKDKEETEALAGVSSAINDVMRKKVERLASSGRISPEDAAALSSFHDKYGGFLAVERAADNAHIRTMQGEADKDAGKLIQPAGSSMSLTSLRGAVKGAVDRVIPKGDTLPSPETEALYRAVTRDSRIMDNIRDMSDLAGAPPVLPTGPDVGLSARSAALRGLGREGVRTGVIGGAYASGLGQPTPDARAEAPSLQQMIQPDPFANGLPRDSSLWDDKAIVTAMAQTAASGKAPVVQGMIVKLKEAERQRDDSKKERVLADLSRIAPEIFEAGKGINGKLFHLDDQNEYMTKLRHAYRNGTVDASFLARQQKAFSDASDSRILPLELSQYQLQKMSKDPRLLNHLGGLIGGANTEIGVGSSPRSGEFY